MRTSLPARLHPDIGVRPRFDPRLALPGLCSPGDRNGHGRRAARRARRGDRRALERALAARTRRSRRAIAGPRRAGDRQDAPAGRAGGARRRAGASCSRAAASELEQDLPFWVFVDALDEYVAGLDPRRLASLEDDVRGELAGLLPVAVRLRRAGRPRRRTSATARIARCGELLERLAATKPLVLVLDDVHWADSASIELLGALLRDRRPRRAAGDRRTAAADAGAPDERARARHRAGRADAARAGRARARRGRELLGEESTARWRTSSTEESGGNPFYLEQLAPPSLARGAPARSGAILGGSGVPRRWRPR